MMSDQQCSPVVQYWMSFFRRTEMGLKSKDVTRSARFSGFNWRKGSVEAFSGVHMEIGVEDCIQDEVLRSIFCSCVT